MLKINDIIKFKEKEYVITKFLGQGGMGQVFLIESKDDGHKLALKSLQYFLPNDSNYRSLFNEWEKAQTIKHHNVINYHGFHDGSSSPETPYLIMELANDGSLEDFLKLRMDLLTEDECLNIFHQIIDGMEAVNNTLVHRDIKPDNIFINDQVFKIADFGLAKIAQDKTRSKTFKGWGTEPYIAPEAYRSEKNTIQMDMYSIGHVFYQIAALKHAFGLPDDWEYAHLTATPDSLSSINISISPKVSAVINKLIAKKPSNRYISWDEVRQDLIRSTQNTGSNKSIIDNILGKKLSRDLVKERELTAIQIKEKEHQRKLDILRFQFENEIISPISNLINEFNAVSDNSSAMRINKTSSSGHPSYQISFDEKSISIWFKYINASDSYKFYGNDRWGNQVLHHEQPRLNQNPVLAWGGFESTNGQGFNIVLVASSEDEYGNWYILKNKMSGFSTRNDHRPNPFAFSHDELIKEINLVGAIHIYSTTVTELNINEILQFISTAL
ncbi:serine/threonine-protein kinase [Acinetobacter modestus]|uniref:serine/threonine-protein kinase n=1 Tax=Acinetobacter modestus TaxID=1776740 RepID=UPI001F4B8BF6|nr:serine/threonine-protein kinase [Acinetobacter modestus]MCH7330241.1 serine/threonine protein kinase [Acinetobacter modestus]